MSKKKSLFLKSVDFQLPFSELLNSAINAVDPVNLVLNHLAYKNNELIINDKSYDLTLYNNIHVLGVGKGASHLYFGLKKIIGDKISGGIIVSLEEKSFKDVRVKFLPGSHPIPDEKSLAAGKRVKKYAEEQVGPDDLVIFLLTGGASSLMVLPHSNLSFRNKIKVNQLLLASGANISEINCVRKHMSALKGGRLAEIIYPAKILSLVLSDVIDSPLEDIGSGPCFGDSTSFANGLDILKKYNILTEAGPAVGDFFFMGTSGSISDTPSPNSDRLKHNDHFILGDNFIALKELKYQADNLNIPAAILTAGDSGEAKEAATFYAAILKEIIRSDNPFEKPILLLSGGELTVSIKNPNGKGGRNQEFILHLLNELKGIQHPFFALSMGTDGIDGPTDAAGAWINEQTYTKVKKSGLKISDYLANNNSYNFFKEIDQLILTGPTNTNVMDIRIFFLK